ncbi:MAG: hydrolase [Clostridiales bacterium]|nr:hydrolase [Clostridiales bacterium]
MTLKINIIRGQNQIGGSIIEVYTEQSRIILDAGANMGERKLRTFVPDVDGLFEGKPAYDAVFVSHYHSDHMGLLKYVVPGIPIYMGRDAYNIARAMSEYKGKKLDFSPTLMDAGVPVTVGDITLTPVLCDHSAYGTFMFLIRACGKTVLYSADFRSTGRMDFSALLEELPEVDVLITEGTTLSRGLDFHEPREQELEDFAVETLAGRKGPALVYLSAQNVDRIVTAYNAARRSSRRFIMDELTALIAETAGLKIDGSVLRASHSLADLGEIVATSVGGGLSKHRRATVFPAVSERKAFASNDFMLCFTPQSLINFQKVLHRTSFKDGVLFLARRETEILKPAASAFISFMKSIGAEVPVLHTSGHADSDTIDRLIRDVRPSVIIPVHTELAEWFARYEDECIVIYDCKDYEV